MHEIERRGKHEQRRSAHDGCSPPPQLGGSDVRVELHIKRSDCHGDIPEFTSDSLAAQLIDCRCGCFAQKATRCKHSVRKPTRVSTRVHDSARLSCSSSVGIRCLP